MSQTVLLAPEAGATQSLALLQAENRVLELATRNTPLPDILHALALSAEQLAGEDVLCSILLLDPEGAHLLHGAAPSLPEHYNAAIHGIPIGPTVGSCGTAAATRREVVVSDIATHPYWAPFKELAVGSGLRACWSTPIFSSGGAVLGTFAMYYTHPAEPDLAAREIVQILSRTAALVLERSRLHDELQREIAGHIQTEDLLRSAQQAARLATWSWNESDDTLEFAPGSAEIFPLRLADICSRERLLSLVRDEDRGPVTAAFRSALETRQDFQVEFGFEQNGQMRWILVTGRAVEAGSRVNGSLAGACMDITRRRQAEEALRASEKLAATGRLAATIAHEINNPLEAVTNFIYLAKNNAHVPDPVRRYLEIADSELARVSHIAQQTLGFYRDTSQPTRVDLASVLDDVLLLYERKLGYKSLTIERDFRPGLVLTGLPGELRQVISNLLSNAVDACPDDARIRIRGRVVNSRARGCREVRITVADEGCGMPQEVQQRAFTPFFTTKQEVGTGLGLWVSRGIIEKHNGTLAFRSRSTGKPGTVFRIVLPSGPCAPAYRSN